MVAIHVVHWQQQTPSRWQNGNGWTRELLAWPLQQPDAWQVRLSVAEIDSDCAFSAFAGVQRWIAVLRGHGIQLAGKQLTQHSPVWQFDGSQALPCALIQGPTQDLNFMLRGNQARGGQLWRLHDQATLCYTEQTLLRGVFSVAGCRLRCVQTNEVIDLQAMTLVWSQDSVDDWQVEAASSADFGFVYANSLQATQPC